MCDDQPILSSGAPLPVAFSRRCFFVLLHCVGHTFPAEKPHVPKEHIGCVVLRRWQSRGDWQDQSRQGALQVAARVHATTGKRSGTLMQETHREVFRDQLF